MGGCIPLGYDVKDRHLVVNSKEAEQVREIFRLYLEYGCVKKLKACLDAQGTTSKIRISRSGNKTGGAAYSRGSLYKILRNKTYLGEVPHKNKSYPGEHAAIIDLGTWEKVRVRMAESIRGERYGRNAAYPSPLRGLVYDEEGNRFTPSHAVKSGRRYRYYVSQLAIEDAKSVARGSARIPAREIENLVLGELKCFFTSADRVTSDLGNGVDDLATTRLLIQVSERVAKDLDSNAHESISELLSTMVERVVIRNESVEIELKRAALRERFLGQDLIRRENIPSQSPDTDHLVLPVAAKLKRCRGEMRLIIPSPDGVREPRTPIPSLLKAIARAQDWVRAIMAGEYRDQREIAAALKVNERYVSHLIAGAFVAPKVVEAMIEGREHREMNLASLIGNVSLSWKEQYTRFARIA